MSPPETADVLIVGAGAAGGVAAKHLAEHGFRVVVLEQGHWPKASDLPGLSPEYDLLALGPWHPNPNVRRRTEDYPVNHAESAVEIGMFNGIGGTTNFYAACWCRALPSDFRVRTLDGVADDWPLTYEELEPYYRQVEQEMGVSGHPNNPAYPAGFEPPLPSLPIGEVGRVMAAGMNALGWHWWPGYNAIASRGHGRQAQCVRYGVCRSGCPAGAKASTDLTHFPDAQAHGARIETGARVARITLDEHGLANGAVYIQDGVEKFQPASVVILAANGIGTPRLLLMSASAGHPDGLANNSSGLVGKRLMTHPHATSAGLYEDDLEDWTGPVGEAIESMQFYETDPARGFARGSKWHIMPAGARPLLHVGRWIDDESQVSGEPFWGKAFTERLKSTAGHLIEWIVLPDDLPEEGNTVTLDDALTDSDGLPAAKVHYVTSENTNRNVEWNLRRTLEAHEAAGATKAWVVKRNMASWHNLGTTRMGDDPATSVVNRWGQAHDVPNLYIVDGSVFVTATGVNPTATICAVAKRTATYLTENRRRQKVSNA